MALALDPPREQHFHRSAAWRGVQHPMAWRMTRTGRFYLRCEAPDCNVLRPDPGRRYIDPDFVAGA